MNELNKLIFIIILLLSFQYSIFIEFETNKTNKSDKISINRKLNEKKIRKRKIWIFIDDTYIKSQNNGRYSN